MEQIKDFLLQYVNVSYLVTFMLLSYLIKQYFQIQLNKLFKTNVKLVYVVLIIATILAIPFLLTKSNWQQILFSYALGTSLHEIAFSQMENEVKKVTGLSTKTTTTVETKDTSVIKESQGTSPV
jgi:hypothetical protein